VSEPKYHRWARVVMPTGIYTLNRACVIEHPGSGNEARTFCGDRPVGIILGTATICNDGRPTCSLCRDEIAEYHRQMAVIRRQS